MEVCRGRIGFVVFIQVVVMGVVVVAVSIRILSLAFVVVAGCCRSIGCPLHGKPESL